VETQTENKTLELTQEALKTLHAMGDKVREIGANYGRESKEFSKAASSLAFSLIQMLNLGGRISKDGELSLYCVTNNDVPYLHDFGVNYHRSDKDDTYGEWSVNS
jgi:hypothetical protein